MKNKKLEEVIKRDGISLDHKHSMVKRHVKYKPLKERKMEKSDETRIKKSYLKKYRNFLKDISEIMAEEDISSDSPISDFVLAVSHRIRKLEKWLSFAEG